MDDSSQFFNYSFQTDEGGSTQIFDGSTIGNHGDYHPHFTAGPYTHSIPPSTAFSSKETIRPALRSPSALPARASIQVGYSGFGFNREASTSSGHLEIPGTDGSKLATPGLSSGSSATPDTRSSAQATTPDNFRPIAPAQPTQPPQAVFPPLAPTPPPGRKRPGRQKRKELSAEEGEAKRNKFLERNRVAATKCRQKKKEWMSDLEDTRFGLESQNSHLQMEYNSLAEEVSQIRAELMAHGNCNDPNINKWIENEAKRYVLNTGERMDAMLAAFDQGSPGPDRQGSMSTTSGYGPSTSNDLMSPGTNRGRISLLQSTGNPSSPVFFRGNMSTDQGETRFPITESAYMQPTTRAEDSPNFGYFNV